MGYLRAKSAGLALTLLGKLFQARRLQGKRRRRSRRHLRAKTANVFRIPAPPKPQTMTKRIMSAKGSSVRLVGFPNPKTPTPAGAPPKPEAGARSPGRGARPVSHSAQLPKRRRKLVGFGGSTASMQGPKVPKPSMPGVPKMTPGKAPGASAPLLRPGKNGGMS